MICASTGRPLQRRAKLMGGVRATAPATAATPLPCRARAPADRRRRRARGLPAPRTVGPRQQPPIRSARVRTALVHPGVPWRVQTGASVLMRQRVKGTRFVLRAASDLPRQARPTPRHVARCRRLRLLLRQEATLQGRCLGPLQRLPTGREAVAALRASVAVLAGGGRDLIELGLQALLLSEGFERGKTSGLWEAKRVVPVAARERESLVHR